MTAADRPSVTDTTGVQVGDSDPWTGDYEICETRMTTRFICTAPKGHSGPHVAAGGARVMSVEQPLRPSVTDDARAEAVRIVDSCLPDDLPVDLYRYAIKAVDTLASRGLLAAGRAETPVIHLSNPDDGASFCDQPVTIITEAGDTRPVCQTCHRGAMKHAHRRAETTTATTEDMATRLAAAEAELDRLCNGGRFTMSIPAREGYDSDLLIQAALSDLRGLLAAGRAETTTETTEAAIRQEVEYRLRTTAAYFRMRGEHGEDPEPGFLAMEIAAATARLTSLLATARTRPTETTTEWGVRSEWTPTTSHFDNEHDARAFAARIEGRVVVRREVTAWTEADRG